MILTIVDGWKKSIFRANPAHVYHRRILINGMSVTVMATWFPLPLLQQANGFMAHQNWSNIMVSLLSKSWGNRHQDTVPGMQWKQLRILRQDFPKVSIFPGQVCLLRNDFQVLRLLHYMHFHCWSSFCVWLHCMKAGAFLSRSCWLFRLVSWGLSVLLCCAALVTMSFSRSVY